jgi:hypothetical protein
MFSATLIGDDMNRSLAKKSFVSAWQNSVPRSSVNKSGDATEWANKFSSLENA